MKTFLIALLLLCLSSFVSAHELEGMKELDPEFRIHCDVLIGPNMYIVCLDPEKLMCQAVVIQHGVFHGGRIAPCKVFHKELSEDVED